MQQFDAARIAKQRAGATPRMNDLRRQYASGADKNVKGVETRYTDSWNLEGMGKGTSRPADADQKHKEYIETIESGLERPTDENGQPMSFRKQGGFR